MDWDNNKSLMNVRFLYQTKPNRFLVPELSFLAVFFVLLDGNFLPTKVALLLLSSLILSLLSFWLLKSLYSLFSLPLLLWTLLSLLVSFCPGSSPWPSAQSTTLTSPGKDEPSPKLGAVSEAILRGKTFRPFALQWSITSLNKKKEWNGKYLIQRNKLKYSFFYHPVKFLRPEQPHIYGIGNSLINMICGIFVVDMHVISHCSVCWSTLIRMSRWPILWMDCSMLSILWVILDDRFNI